MRIRIHRCCFFSLFIILLVWQTENFSVAEYAIATMHMDSCTRKSFYKYTIYASGTICESVSRVSRRVVVAIYVVLWTSQSVRFRFYFHFNYSLAVIVERICTYKVFQLLRLQNQLNKCLIALLFLRMNKVHFY